MGEDQKLVYVILSVVISALAFIPYFIETWKVGGVHDTRPTVSGFVCWVLTDIVIFAVMVTKGEISWQMVPYIVGALILIGLCVRKSLLIAKLRGESGSLRDAFSDWCRRDTLCLASVVAAIAVWAINRNPDYAIYLTIFSFSVGTYAIVVPLIKNPRTESMFAWGMFLLGGLFGVAAIPAWTVTGALVPIYFAVMQAMMFVLCARRYQRKFVAA
ncbi:MAG: hypothetical protein KBD06_00055 [Candidatus Pacebacteria bacterium]|nr:hypothetical protein [Candidatus Paceibacterota bacterium]